MNKLLQATLIILFSGIELFSQNTITGNFSSLGNQSVRLVGFDGFEIYTIDSVKASANGTFSMSYQEKDYGMAYLAANDNKSFIVVLADETMRITGENFATPGTIRITGSHENNLFGRYATEHPQREQALSAWDYLEKIYRMDSLFTVQKRPKKAIEKERNRIKAEDQQFLEKLDRQTYVSWYLPVRKLVSLVGTVAQYRTEELPATIEAFRQLDYTDARMYKSGLLRDAIEAHFWLIENSGRSLDSVYVEMNKSIDRMMPTLITDEKKFNEITNFLFKLLEKRSLFGSSEYLAVKVLNEQSCTINNELAAQLESYRAMKKGNIAPDFEFKTDLIAPGYIQSIIPKKLSDVKSKYTVVVFGASWCNACKEELVTISQLYPKWKEHGLEVVFFSLDEDKQSFKNFAANFPFISVCDYQKWGSVIVKSYHVFATPTIYLLDEKREIVLQPNSARHLDAWVDWFLIKKRD
ncbi:MAG: TlpA disulfide reductase family protein [Paludibacter sp.]|nr:TlpA disulfide reductase family protein [Paludibacter sp.]